MSDDLIKALDALGEDDFYYRPATTKAMIDKATAEIARLRAACDNYFRTISLSQMRHGRILVGLERRNARQRRALAKLCLRRHDKNAEIARLRDAINNALLEPWSDGQLSGTWHQEPIGPNETPEEAIKRLVRVRAEWAVYRNNCENPEIARLRADLATARREGMEEAAERLQELHKNHKYDPLSGALIDKLGKYDRWPESAKTAMLEHHSGYYRALAEGVAHILRAAAKEVKP